MPLPANVLVLPDISSAPHELVIRSENKGVADVALGLVDAGVLCPEHWRGNIIDACITSLQAMVQSIRPEPLAPLGFSFLDDISNASDYDLIYEHWQQAKKLSGRVGGFVLRTPGGDPFHGVIGPTVLALESCRARLGQTVLHAIEEGIMRSTRGCTPRQGIYWASYAYWMGENDESTVIEEQLMNDSAVDYKKLSDEEKKKHTDQYELFRRADYEKAIPGWASTGKLKPLPLDELDRIWCDGNLPGDVDAIVAATIPILRWLRHPKNTTSDMGNFESVSWEVVPFLLRWSDDDPLAQIWDDVLNEQFNAGDRDMEICSIFAFSTPASLVNAVHRLRNYFELLQMTERLVRLVAETERSRWHRSRIRIQAGFDVQTLTKVTRIRHGKPLAEILTEVPNETRSRILV